MHVCTLILFTTLCCSPIFHSNFDVTKYISGLTRDTDGKITGAKFSKMNYYLKWNKTEVDGVQVSYIKTVPTTFCLQDIF